MQSCQIKPGIQEHSDNSIYLWPCIWRQTLFLLSDSLICFILLLLQSPLDSDETSHQGLYVEFNSSTVIRGVHAPQLLILCSRARGPKLLSACAPSTRACCPRPGALHQEKPHSATESPLLTTTREQPVQQRGPSAAGKYINTSIFKRE